MQDVFAQSCLGPRLIAARQRGRLGHAWLLTGDDAQVLERFAAGWIDRLACSALGDDQQPCGQCQGCLGRSAGTLPLHELRAQSASRQILVDSLRQFQGLFQLKVGRDELKIGLIHEAERMVEQAQNAFLKNLEEPPAQTLFILTTVNPQSLLDTIRSRCRVACINVPLDLDALPTQAWPELGTILPLLQPALGSEKAIEAASRLRILLAAVQKQAAAKAAVQSNAHWESFRAADLDDQIKEKDRKELLDTLTKTVFRAERERLLAAIEAHFAALASRACLDEAASAGLPARAERLLALADLVEDLRHDLNFAMADDMALEAFCLRVCRK